MKCRDLYPSDLWMGLECSGHQKRGPRRVHDPLGAGDTYALLSGSELPRADLCFAAQEKLIGKWTFTRDENGVVSDESGRGHVAKLIDGASLVDDGASKALKLVGPRSHAQVQRTPAFDFACDAPITIGAYLWGDHTRYGQGLIIGNIAIRSLGRMVRRP